MMTDVLWFVIMVVIFAYFSTLIFDISLVFFKAHLPCSGEGPWARARLVNNGR